MNKSSLQERKHQRREEIFRMVKEDVFRPTQIRLHKSTFKQNMKDSEEYSTQFLLYYRKEPKEGMPEIF